MSTAAPEATAPSNLDEWRAAIARGWSVMPLRRADKKPPIKWKHLQSRRMDFDDAYSLIRQFKGCNLGVITGEISGIVVLDVDGAYGMESLSQFPVPPKTPCVKTSRGWHYYFRWPGYKVRNEQGFKRGEALTQPGLDLRADGGYVVGAGSVHESGFVYNWLTSPDDCPVADMPDWLLQIIRPAGSGQDEDDAEETLNGAAQTRIPTGAPDNGQAYVLAALEREARKVQGAPDGGKHSQLLRSAIAIAGFVPIVSEQEIEHALFAAVRDRAVDKHNALSTIRDGIRYGSRRPRQVPPPRMAKSITMSPLLKRATYPIRVTTDEQPQTDEDGVIIEDEAVLSDETIELLRDAPLTDAGNAECMAAVVGHLFRYDHNRKAWRVWDINRWTVDGDGAADRAALAVVRARQQAVAGIDDHDKKKKAFGYLVGAENTAKRKAMLTAASTLPALTTTIDQYDTNHWLVTTPQNTFDLKTGEVLPHSQDHLITMQLGTYFDQEAKAPRWERFLDEVFAGDKELISFIRRAVGYSLTGDTSEQVMFLCYGTGANGKSVFLEVLAQLAGDYAGNAAFSTFDADRRTEATNDLAALKGKHLVTVIEADEDRRLAEARVKAVTGQDPITCRFLYCDPFTYTPTYKLWMAVNHKPTIRGTDRGIWRRIRLIPFRQSFEGKEDRKLPQTLRGELPGILNWAFAGLREWHRDGLGTAAIVEAATEEYRKESDLVGQWFEDCCVSDPRSTTLAGEAYDSFRQWCKSYGFREPTQTSFARSLVERGYERVRDMKSRYYDGFRLYDPISK